MPANTIPTDLNWETHRYPKAVYGPQGVSYRSAKVSPTEYVTVKLDAGEWDWNVYTTRRHTGFGAALSLHHGTAATLAAAKAAALTAWENLPA